MLGLVPRLHLARTLVWTGLRGTPVEVAEVTGKLSAAAAGVVVLVQPDAQPGDLGLGYRAALAGRSGNTILGLAEDAATMQQVRADLFVTATGAAAVRGHEWSLLLRTVRDSGQLAAGLADRDCSGLVVASDLIAEAVRLAPPSDPASKVWFASLGPGRDAAALVAAGARRIAYEAGPSDGVAAEHARIAGLLEQPWRAEMQPVTMAALRLG